MSESTETVPESMDESTRDVRTAVHETVSHTVAAIKVVGRRRDSGLVLVASTVAYLLVYLFAVSDLALTGSGGASVIVANDPLARLFEPVGFSRFEPIAIVQIGILTYLFSPVNALIALFLSTLVGINLALTYLGFTQPRACGLEASTSVLAGIPALLSGAACCGPILLIILGIQATGVLITGFQLLVPIAAIILLGSLLLIGRQVDPALV